MADELYDDNGILTMFPRGTTAPQDLDSGSEQGMNVPNAANYGHRANVNDQRRIAEQEFLRNLDPRLRGDFVLLDQLQPQNANTTSPVDVFTELSTEVDKEYGKDEETHQARASDQHQKHASYATNRWHQEYLGPASEQIRNPTLPDAPNRVGVEQKERAEQLPKSAYRQSQKRSKARSITTSSSSTSYSGGSSQVPSLAHSLHSFSSRSESVMDLKWVKGIQCWEFTSMSFHPKFKIVREYHCAVPDCDDGREDKSWSSFKKHWFNVHAVKPFLCEEEGCNRAFACQSHLDRHTPTHTGEKNYICNICRRAFNRNDLRDRHKENVHG